MSYITYYEANKAIRKLRKSKTFRTSSERERWVLIKRAILHAKKKKEQQEKAEVGKKKTRKPRKKKAEKESEITKEEFEKLVRKYNL